MVFRFSTIFFCFLFLFFYYFRFSFSFFVDIFRFLCYLNNENNYYREEA